MFVVENKSSTTFPTTGKVVLDKRAVVYLARQTFVYQRIILA